MNSPPNGAAISKGQSEASPPSSTASKSPVIASVDKIAIVRRAAVRDPEGEGEKAVFSGRRARNPAKAAVASATPAKEGATNRPNISGSRTSDHEPCSFGRNVAGLGAAILSPEDRGRDRANMASWAEACISAGRIVAFPAPRLDLDQTGSAMADGLSQGPTDPSAMRHSSNGPQPRRKRADYS
jgi:hypothetical protein